jgi:hypothetical protein
MSYMRKLFTSQDVPAVRFGITSFFAQVRAARVRFSPGLMKSVFNFRKYTRGATGRPPRAPPSPSRVGYCPMMQKRKKLHTSIQLIHPRTQHRKVSRCKIFIFISGCVCECKMKNLLFS